MFVVLQEVLTGRQLHGRSARRDLKSGSGREIGHNPTHLVTLTLTLMFHIVHLTTQQTCVPAQSFSA